MVGYDWWATNPDGPAVSTITEQTRCPHCHIAFHVSATQLKAAQGTVRCGICLNVFDAAEHRCVTPPPKSATPAAHPDQDRPIPTMESPASSASVGANDTDDAGTTPAASGECNDSELADEEIGVDRAAEMTPAMQATATSEPEPEPEPEPGPEPNQRQLDLDRLARNLARTGDTTIAADDEHHGKTAKPGRSPGQQARHLLTFTAGALLIGTLSLQLLFHYSTRLSLNPNYRAAVELLCSQLNCRVAEFRNPRLVSVEAVSIQMHAPVTDAMTLEAILINHAPHAQPFPTITLLFKDIDGQIVAQRSFGPNQYLPERLSVVTAMQPSLAYQARLELVAPDQEAVSYSLTVSEN